MLQLIKVKKIYALLEKIVGLSYLKGMRRMIRCHLNALMEERGIKLPKLAEETGLSYPGLYQLKKGNTKAIHFETLETLCKYFHVQTNRIIEYVPDP